MDVNVVEKAEEAITEVFNDTAVGQLETRKRLEKLIEFINDMLGALLE